MASNGNECSVFDTYPYVIVAAVSSGSAMVSALCCLFVIGVIFWFKKHYFSYRGSYSTTVWPPSL